MTRMLILFDSAACDYLGLAVPRPATDDVTSWSALLLSIATVNYLGRSGSRTSNDMEQRSPQC